MELNFKREESIDLDNVGYGDVLILGDDSKWLIIKDTDYSDYRGVNLETYALTDYASTIENLVDYEFVKPVVRVIKSDDLVMEVVG